MTGHADHPLVVDVAELRRHLASRHPVSETVMLDDLTTSGASVPPGEPLVVDLVLESVPDGVVATGGARAPWRAACRRCLTAVGGTLAAPMREVFQDEPDDDADILPIVEDHVDLRAPVRDAVVLALPLAPLCAETCRGLCPMCGIDRNLGECDCVIDTTDPRWAPLSELTFDDEPDED